MKLKFFIILLLLSATKAEAQTSALAIADSLYAVGNYSEAIEELEKFGDKSEVILLRLAQAQKANGNMAAALANYNSVLESNPERILTAVEYAKLLSSTGKLKEADSIFKQLVKQYPMNANFHYQLGLVKEKQNDSTAMNHYNITVLLQKNHQQALAKVAKRALVSGKLLEAERLSKQGLDTNPTNLTLLSILAQAYYFQKEYKLATDPFEKLVSLGEGSEFIHSRLGTSYYHLEQIEKAIDNFELALSFEDKNHATHYSLGKLYAMTGNYKKSEFHLLAAILLKDQILDEEFTSLGLTYKFKDEPKKALEYFNRALEENPDNERAMFERAIAGDSFYKDLETRLKLYEAYLEKYEPTGDSYLRKLARRRVKDLREEIHMAASAKEDK
ncbi:Tetratricopeptide repeat-containing protein [Salinimicrobium sediminis]|uniref:Tetratricopeptide repeat-containing protein n=1 Tax=Salinimicrobium sediminis TaxID=1343891 RepID=A0A285X5V0_9FLAO|nr:tetratricopeptide repeat protein [Salinimicrobium sediminis]SOC79789.1 Tetratricopeptide repeat-containing protein [Salinimicrobium sediminis]